MANETQQEYIHEQLKSKAQEEALRCVNQKLADKAMDVCVVYWINFLTVFIRNSTSLSVVSYSYDKNVLTLFQFIE